MTNDVLNAVVDSARVGVWNWRVDTGELKLNERWAEIIGYTLKELEPISIDTWAKIAHPEDLQASNEKLQRCFNKEEEYYDHLARMKHKKGHWVWVQDRGKVIEWNEDGTPKRMVGSHNDLTEEVKLRNELAQALQQRELLLQEVHHRVKNNLLTLRSLAQVRSENGRVSLQELNDTITAISKMHEAVYLTQSYEMVTVRWYLERVLKEMILPANVSLRFDIEETAHYWKTENLVPLGILTTELVTNGYKHSGKEEHEQIQVHVSLQERDNYLYLTVQDNGVGFSEDAPEIEDAESIGFMLIDMYAQKLNGTCTYWNDEGAVTQCKFPLIN